MKKILSLFIILACIFLLCSCGLAGYIFSVGSSMLIDEFYHDYEKAPETFHLGRASVTLTEAFYSIDYEIALQCHSINGTFVMLEEWSLMMLGYEEGLSTAEYAALIKSDNEEGEVELLVGLITLADVVEADGLVYMESSFGEEDDLKGIVSVYSSGDTLWLCTFYTTAAKSDVYMPYFLEWAASVEISNANQEV